MAYRPGVRLLAREGHSSPGSIRPDVEGEEEEYSMADEGVEGVVKYVIKEEGGGYQYGPRGDESEVPEAPGFKYGSRGGGDSDTSPDESRTNRRGRGRDRDREGRDREREAKYKPREQRKPRVQVMDPLLVPEAVYNCPECHETFVKKIGLIRHLCSIIHYAGVLKADLPEESHQKPYQCPMCYKPNRDISTLLRHYGGTESKLIELGCVDWQVLEDRPRKKPKQALVLPAPTMGYQQRERWLQARAAKKPEKRKELAHTMTARIKVKPRHFKYCCLFDIFRGRRGSSRGWRRGRSGSRQGGGRGRSGPGTGCSWWTWGRKSPPFWPRGAFPQVIFCGA